MNGKIKSEYAQVNKDNLTETFQNYKSNDTDTPSEEVRERVFSTLFNFEFAFKVIDLFTVKLIETILRLLEDMSKDSLE